MKIVSLLVLGFMIEVGSGGGYRIAMGEEPVAVATDPLKQDLMATAEPFVNLVQLGPGVHMVKLDDNGQVISCVAVGESRMSTVLGAARGKQNARNNAALRASGEFAKWLREEVSVVESTSQETILTLESQPDESGEAAIPLESGRAIEKSTAEYTSKANAVMRGLLLLHVHVDPTSKTCTVVKGWSVANAEAARQARADNLLDESDPKSNVSPRTSPQLEGSTVTSPAAAGFLP